MTKIDPRFVALDLHDAILDFSLDMQDMQRVQPVNVVLDEMLQAQPEGVFFQPHSREMIQWTAERQENGVTFYRATYDKYGTGWFSEHCERYDVILEKLHA